MTRKDFDRIWLPLMPGFYRIAYYILESKEDAEDAVQDLFLKLWKSATDGLVNPKAYGTALIKNLCIDRVRSKKVRQTEQLKEDLAQEEETIGKEEATRLILMIDRLPEKQAKVMKLRFIKEMSYEDISTLTGMSQQNLRVIVSNARKSLKQNFG